jgi:hypothetical protein
VKVSIVRGGGLAGLVTTTAVEEGALSPEDASELRAKVEEAGVFDLPPKLTGRPNQADRFNYALTVEDHDRRHTVLMSEDALPEGVRDLISWVSTAPGREDRIGPPGDQPPAT